MPGKVGVCLSDATSVQVFLLNFSLMTFTAPKDEAKNNILLKNNHIVGFHPQS